MAEQKRVHIFITGFVHGVTFRMTTKYKAKLLGLNGWVKNISDGKVEAVFEGEKEKVEEMLNWAKKGPPGAKVDRVEVKWEEYKGEFKNFEIKYN